MRRTILRGHWRTALGCTNCGNYILDDESVCQTCGTPKPVDTSEGAERVVADAPTTRAGVVVGAVLALTLAVGVGALFLVRGGGSEGEAEEGVVAESSTEPASATEPDAGAGDELVDIRPFSIEGSLPRLGDPQFDPAIGMEAPAVVGVDFEGNEVTIENDGRPKVIVFLAHWCPHCQREVPEIQAFVDTTGLPEGIDLITVATATDPEQPNYPPEDWLVDEGWTAPVIVDEADEIAAAYGLSGFPYWVFVREDFTVDLRITGEFPPDAVFDYAVSLFGPGPEPIPVGPTDYEAACAQPTACGGEAPADRELMSFSEPGPSDVATSLTFATSCGDIVVELDPGAAPESVASMVFLAEAGYFDGTICHRLISGFVLQCGDPTGTGLGNPGYVVPDEFPEAGTGYVPGVVAMANSGPGSTGSQFFVVIGDAINLPPSYTVIGSVADVGPLIEALDTVPLGSSPGGELSSPLETIYIKSAIVSR